MFDVFTSAWRHRDLVLRLTQRESVSRYRGSILGILWAALLPLVTIGIYTFVFGVIFKARWQQPEGAAPQYSFAMLLFAGFLSYGIFADTANRAAGLMLENVSYIKKVVFPLDILPWVLTAGACVNAAIGFGIFIVIFVALYGVPYPTIALLPLALMPIALISLGFTFLLSSLGVFLRDLRQIIPLLTTIMLFLSPVFYPMDSVPTQIRPLLILNPLTLGIGHVRQVVFFGEVPNLVEWSIYILSSLAIAIAGHAWFARTKKAFADVL